MTAPRHFHQAVAAAKAGIGKGDSVTRPTADIVADLRAIAATMAASIGALPELVEAADRLAELSRKEVRAEGERIELADIDALRPPCPTCGGTEWVDGDAPGVEFPCSDCLDGKVSVAQLAATWHEAIIMRSHLAYLLQVVRP